MRNQYLDTTTDINLSGKIAADNFFVLRCDATAKAFTATVPDSNGIRNIICVIIKTDSGSNAVTISPAITGQQFNGYNTLTLSFKGDAYMIFPYKSGFTAFKSGADVTRFE